MEEKIKKEGKGDNPKEYELSFLIRAKEDEASLREAISKAQGHLSFMSEIKQIRLAYSVKKHDSAFFGFYNLTIPSGNIGKIKKDLGLLAQVLRFLIISPPIKLLREPARKASPLPAPPVLENKKGKPEETVLTNEALEQKLEEILK